MGIYQFDPKPDPHFQFICEHGAWGTVWELSISIES